MSASRRELHVPAIQVANETARLAARGGRDARGPSYCRARNQALLKGQSSGLETQTRFHWIILNVFHTVPEVFFIPNVTVEVAFVSKERISVTLV